MNKFNLMILSFIFWPLVSLAECPVGAKEDHLTLARVMRNFGSYTMNADTVSRAGANPAERASISEAQLSEVVSDLGIAIACAEAALNNPTGDMLPSKLKNFADEAEKSRYLATYFQYMTEFKRVLVEYQDLFKKILSKPSVERAYDDVNSKRQEMDQLANIAHQNM